MNSAPRIPQILKPEPKPLPDYRARDTLFAYLCIPVCYLFVKSEPLSSPALGTMLAFLLITFFSLAYLRLSDTRPSAFSWSICCAILMLCVGFLTNASTVIRTLLSPVLMVVLPVFVHTCCKKDFLTSFSSSPINRMADALFTTPFASLPDNLVAFIPKRKGKKSRFFSGIGWCLVGLVGAVIPTVIVAALLSYDEQFTNLLDQIIDFFDRIFSFSPENLFEHVGDVIFACLLGVGLFAVLFGNLLAAKAVQQGESATENANALPCLQVLPKPLLAAFVTPVLLLYVLFFVSQWNYYVSAFTHTLPEGLTYAQYAREGFFQLCIVSAFNAILLIILQTFMRRTPGEKGILRRIYGGIISLFTLILIATALSKLILYINAYGMTRSRVLAAWMILLLAVVFILSLIHAFCKKFPFSTAILITCVLFSLILFLPNIDGMIANYNADAYLSGNLSSVDVDALCDLDFAAVPALSRLEEHLLSQPSLDEKSAALLEETTARLDDLAKWSADESNSILDFNIPVWRAKQMLEGRG